MQPRPGRNNLLAGLFVLMSLGLAVAVSFVLAKRGAGSNATRFVVRFTLSDGAAGLQSGSAVTLGGQPVGRVLSVDFDGAGGGESAPTGVWVRVEVRRDIVLYENASVYLERPLLGTLSSINIVSPGGPGAGEHQGASERVEGGDVVVATLAPPAFLSQAGLGPEQVEQIKQTVADAQKAVERLGTMIDKSSPEVETALADARTLIADARTNLGRWNQSVDSALQNVEAASTRLSPMLDKGEQVLTDAGGAVASARGLFDDARSALADNRQRIDGILIDVREASAKINSESLASLNDALRDARTAMGQAQLAVTDVRDLLTQEGPNLRRTLANMRVMSDQLKLTAIEVRSHPWRLLHEPSAKELESQALYDATRSYAAAASDVRAAAETVQALTAAAKRDPTEANARKLDEAGEALARAMEGFHDAEQGFLSELVAKDRER
ncbi:MAG: hypothetical protein U0637_10035 [Phycisphaerales bacterium]